MGGRIIIFQISKNIVFNCTVGHNLIRILKPSGSLSTQAVITINTYIYTIHVNKMTILNYERVIIHVEGIQCC